MTGSLTGSLTGSFDRRFESPLLHFLMSQGIEDTVNPHWVRVLVFWGWRLSGELVVAAGVEGELAQELAGGRADDADVQVPGENQDLGPGVSTADADVVEVAGVAQGDGADGPDLVGQETVLP